MTVIEEIAGALKSGKGTIAIVPTFTHGMAAQVMVASRKVGPLILPVDGETIADVLRMLGDLAIATAPTPEHDDQENA